MPLKQLLWLPEESSSETSLILNASFCIETKLFVLSIVSSILPSVTLHFVLIVVFLANDIKGEAWSLLFEMKETSIRSGSSKGSSPIFGDVKAVFEMDVDGCVSFSFVKLCE